MNMVRIITLFLPVLLPVSFVFAQNLNAGFVQGLWYSKTPFFAGDTIRIYTAVQNNSGFDIQGTVEFVVDGSSAGKAEFSAVNGRMVEVWTDWNVREGNHSIEAQITKALKVEIGKAPEPIVLQSASLGTSEVFADQDVDQDGIGDLQDPDDDNDLLKDTEEEALGTDPFNSDSDGDGLSDGKEVELGTDPLSKDTDQDGIPDATEIAQNTDPLSKEERKERATEEVAPSLVAEITEKITAEYVPSLVEQVDSLVQETTGKLKEQKQALEEKKETLSAAEQGLDFLLASAIIALPQWQLGLVLFFAIAAALLLRRLAKPEAPKE